MIMRGVVPSVVSQDSNDEFLNKYIESDEDEDSGICYILFGDKGSNLGF